MSVVQSRGSLLRDISCQFDWESLLEFSKARNKLSEVLSVDHFHGDIRLAFFFTEVIKLNNIGMIEPHSDFDFGFEHLKKFTIGSKSSLNSLNHDQASSTVRRCKARTIDLRHSALRDMVEEKIPSEF